MSQRAGAFGAKTFPPTMRRPVFSNPPVGALAGQFQLHPLGVGFAYTRPSTVSRRPQSASYSVIEIFGQLAVTMLERHMARIASLQSAAPQSHQVLPDARRDPGYRHRPLSSLGTCATSARYTRSDCGNSSNRG